MIPLPPALAAWSEPLSLFPRQLALSLGTCVRRLAQAVGTLPLPSQSSSDQPDGYDGLSRRGSYERLLISEWLLADELPDEFLRRAAGREHAFLALSFRQPGGSRRSVALFDAGPELIGGPRIGQVAALIVLAARAQRDGAPFGWAVVQDETRRISEEVTPAAILRLLYSRTARSATAADLDGWRQAAGEPLEADDLWLIGTGRTPQLGAAGRIELEDALTLGPRQVVATVRRAGAVPRSVELPLPESNDCVRLVRDPFSVRKAPGPLALGSPANGIAFSVNGRRILLRHRNGGISAHPVPNSPRMPPGKPKLFMPPPGETVIAAGWNGTSCVVLTQAAEGVRLHDPRRASRPSLYRMAGSTQLTGSTAPAPLSPLVPADGEPARGEMPRIHVFVDAENALWEVVDGSGGSFIWPRYADVLAFSMRRGRFLIIRHEKAAGARQGTVLDVDVVVSQMGRTEVQKLPSQLGLRAVFGCDTEWIAVERALDQWQVVAGAHSYTLAVPYGSLVFGVARSQKPSEPALLVVDQDRRSVSLLGPSDRVTLLRTRSPILHAIANAACPEIAALAADGTVTVFSLLHRRAVLEIRPPPKAEPPGVELPG